MVSGQVATAGVFLAFAVGNLLVQLMLDRRAVRRRRRRV